MKDSVITRIIMNAILVSLIWLWLQDLLIVVLRTMRFHT